MSHQDLSSQHNHAMCLMVMRALSMMFKLKGTDTAPIQREVRLLSIILLISMIQARGYKQYVGALMREAQQSLCPCNFL